MTICPKCKCWINENPCDCDTMPSERTKQVLPPTAKGVPMSETETIVPVGQPRIVRLSLSFQPYEVEIIKEALNRMRYEKLSRCPWVKQDNGGYCYQPSKEVKRIQFVENSIKRQLSEPNSKADQPQGGLV